MAPAYELRRPVRAVHRVEADDGENRVGARELLERSVAVKVPIVDAVADARGLWASVDLNETELRAPEQSLKHVQQSTVADEGGELRAEEREVVNLPHAAAAVLRREHARVVMRVVLHVLALVENLLGEVWRQALDALDDLLQAVAQRRKGRGFEEVFDDDESVVTVGFQPRFRLVFHLLPLLKVDGQAQGLQKITTGVRVLLQSFRARRESAGFFVEAGGEARAFYSSATRRRRSRSRMRMCLRPIRMSASAFSSLRALVAVSR